MRSSVNRRRSIVLAALFCLSATPSFAQPEGADPNVYYRFPLSVGFEYQSLSPFAEYGSSFNIFELSGNVRVPIPGLPILQPMVKAGMLRFDSQDPSQSTEWDHTHWFGGIGLAFAHRLARNLEMGAEAAVSISQSYFENLLPEAGTVGQTNLILEAGAHIALDPSYNFNIDVHPNVKYLRSFGLMDDFNGLIFSIGFGASYRFGRDPDAPGTTVRSIQFSDVSMPTMFAAMQSYYAKNPAGTVTITNRDKQTISDIDVSFYQNGFMDSPTPLRTIETLGPGESEVIGLRASFNQEVFTTEGVTPLTAEVIVKYTAGGRPEEQTQSVSYDLYDRTAVTWDDDRKVAAFITPSDGALRNYASFIRQACKDVTLPQYSANLQFAIQAYLALGEIGVIYQVDPVLPFAGVQDDPTVIDSVSLPRDTLTRSTGDCDDLTVLYCSLLETVGVPSAFITVPGHIYAAFNTGVEPRDFESIHPDRAMTISLGGSLWVPVEITMIGKAGFREAWRLAIEEWTQYEDDPQSRGFYVTRESQEVYRPVGLRETDLGLQYGSAGDIAGQFSDEMDRLIDDAVSGLVQEAETQDTTREWNRVGIAYAEFRRLDSATDAFRRAVELDPSYVPARLNIANVLFLQGDYREARSEFEQLVADFEQSGRSDGPAMLKLLINLSRTCYQLGSYDDAGDYFARAQRIDPSGADQFSYLAREPSSSGVGRASESEAIGASIEFFGEEDQ